MLLTLVNTSSFISIQGAYDADFLNFTNVNLAGRGPAVCVCLDPDRPAIRRRTGGQALTRFSWRDIVGLSEPATLAEHRHLGVQMLDRLMQHLPRLALTGQDTGVALRDLRVALNLLDLLAYSPRYRRATRAARPGGRRRRRILQGCLKAGERLPAPSPSADDPGPSPPRPQRPGPAGRHPPAPAACAGWLAPGVVARRGIHWRPPTGTRRWHRWSAFMIGDWISAGFPAHAAGADGHYVRVVPGGARVADRFHFYRLVWHRALFNVGLYALLLGAVDSLSRYLMT
jgi:hypothetical protein